MSMIMREKKYSSVVSFTLSLYILFYLFVIQLPGLHNLKVDLNYTEISEYVTIDEDSCFPLGSEQHYHNFVKDVDQYCFLCNLLNSGFDKNQELISDSVLDFSKSIDIVYIDVYTSISHSCLPRLRAPPTL